MFVARTPGGALRLPHGDHMLHWLLGALMVAIFVTEPLSNLQLLPRWIQGEFLPTIVSVCVLGLSRPTRLAKPLIILGLLLPVAEIWVMLQPSVASSLVLALVAASCFVLLIAALLREVFAPGVITWARIEGAIAVYLLIAVGFATLYATAEILSPNSFQGVRPDTAGDDFGSSFLYFSLITQTTVGFGDIVPLHPGARSLSTLQAICGQFYIAVLVSRLVSLEIVDRERRHALKATDKAAQGGG